MKKNTTEDVVVNPIPPMDESWRNSLINAIGKKEGFVYHTKNTFCIQLVYIIYIIPLFSLYKGEHHGMIINDWSFTWLCFSFRYIKYKIV